jgi:hypothetical protein
VCFPEKYLVKVLIPETNKGIEKPMELHNFYVFLGCLFFMSCYIGIEERKAWWSSQPIDMHCSAPFRLNEYMTRT